MTISQDVSLDSGGALPDHCHPGEQWYGASSKGEEVTCRHSTGGSQEKETIPMITDVLYKIKWIHETTIFFFKPLVPNVYVKSLFLTREKTT